MIKLCKQVYIPIIVYLTPPSSSAPKALLFAKFLIFKWIQGLYIHILETDV